MSWVRLVFVLICCSTLENSTNSLVNELASIGLVGSWFCNCVISRFKKSPKFDDNEDSGSVLAAGVAEALADVLAAGAETEVIAVFLRYAVISRPARNQRLCVCR